ncbi:metalloregulator ArsR/SmtB family transcription factor [Halalkalibacterium halodurans]|jgi:ArsR family transcriptional regulator|uniref:Transcriptional regulator (ArsR family) n=2 Tax=Halalkalibacterium halodurans TaxID=86665 RepID=Q9K8L0_HALH5|nr:metalloregulator ArsR/SmtB family transcription factor [Halalkalibacterium halodurans]MDY7223541.1 metalloregulator ArsR/SmtB family transcription factor [Halalkalibacterium halodurans]MDY7242762.1 metalloregulator ArsR/SmtB family transcription factor [Halalkalibacterium halodurans]MED3646561.1 metalloregulator ArsR/SmtB family transcription factor [Halalkalibacterium halodurans]MED4082812.1 metalloregulator ArsR/SmtB family transcription factor [Halalkalibacterium halodurans]MED4085971.1 
MDIELIPVKPDFKIFEQKFKALADEKRLLLMYELCQHHEVCVCDLQQMMNLPQSKLSYHLKILLDADLIERQKRGQWNYYRLKDQTVKALLSEQLCCVFRPQ